MLVRTTSPTPSHGGNLAALRGERVFRSEYKYRKGSEVFGEGEDAEYAYQIISGAVRTHKLLPDGRRRINSFHLPGDLFGIENGSTHRFTAEAVVDTRVLITPRPSLLENAIQEAGGTAKLVGLITGNLKHAENHRLLLGRKTAVERVAAFLLEMDERLAHPNIMLLPMGRRDIADYLGLTLETVSRCLSMLQAAQMLRFEGATHRQLELLDRKRLAELDA